MARRGHGDVGVGAGAAGPSFGPAAVGIPTPHFGYFIGKNQRPADADRLPETPQMVAQLRALGVAMADPPPGAADAEGDPKIDPKEHSVAGDGSIPAAYTYFGQFVDHDITLDNNSGSLVDLSNAALKPLADVSALQNERTAFLELDSVYGVKGKETPRDAGERMLVGKVTDVTKPQPRFADIPGKSELNDLPRKPRSADASIDREARIGDPRNDENLIVAQLHVVFLKAHNTLANLLGNFEDARRALIRIYQSVVLDDFLPRVCSPAVVADVKANGPKFFHPDKADLFMPVEFAAAGYRFGHSMVRAQYNFNLNFDPISSGLMFTFTALSGQLGDFDTFPDNWIIQWERFLPLGSDNAQRARPIDARLTPVLFDLRDTLGNKIERPDNAPPGAPVSQDFKDVAPHLATRNLLRGYLLGLPTGQALARQLGETSLEGKALIDSLPSQALKTAAEPFMTRSPLWFYVLAEAGNNNGKLGPVGSRIVVETFFTLIRHSEHSILDANGKRNLGASFTLRDIIDLAAKQDQLQT